MAEGGEAAVAADAANAGLSEEELAKNKAEAEREKQLGNEAYKRRELGEALRHYDRAVELQPRSVAYLLNRGAAKLELNDPDGTIEDCNEAIELNKQHHLHTDFKLIARAYARIGNAWVKKGDLASAIGSYENSLMESHDDKVYTKLREVKRQKADADKQAYVDPEKSVEERQKGNEFFKAGNFPESIGRYSEAILRNPSDPAPYANRAASYMKLGEFPFALKDCDACLKLEPRHVKALSRKGAIHYYLKEYHKSMEAYKKALEIEPNSADIRNELRRTVAAIEQNSTSGEVDEAQVRKAMEDPEIRQILSDPAVNQVLKELSENPKYAQRALSDPAMSDKINKLIAAGIVRVSGA